MEGEIAVQLSCRYCIAGDTKVGWREGRIVHRIKDAVYWNGKTTATNAYHACPDWDLEGRHTSELFGFFSFVWWPVRCRNKKLRWLCWVERHQDGTYSLGNRAH